MHDAIVINTGPLIALAKADAFDLIEKLPFEFYCPVQVQRELRAGVSRGHFAVSLEGLIVRPLADPLNPLARATLDAGEGAVIQLALEQQVPRVCIDERRGRRAALSVGLEVIGTLGLLLRAKKLGFVVALKPYIDRLLEHGYWFDDALLEKVLAAADELPG